jgi:prepilin-type N-terminal cleavage/methylation domain-containing protein
MKKSFSRSRSKRWDSFTLVELLVVIGIIAILAGVLFSAAGYALKAAQRAKAYNLASQIQSGALNFYTEYSVYPIPAGKILTPATDYQLADASANATEWGGIIYVLNGNVHPSTGLATPTPSSPAPATNARGIAYLALKASDVDTTTDAPKNPLPTGTEIYFNIAMDGDYDGVLGVGSSTAKIPNFSATPFNAAAAASGGSCTSGVAVWANCNATTGSTNAQFYVKTF